MHYLDEMFQSGGEGESVFVPVRPGGRPRGGALPGSASGLSVETAEQTSRNWAYRGGQVPADD